MFDYTVDPYTPDEIRELARERNICWLIVKQELQIEEDSVKQFKDELTELLKEDFEPVESLDNYEVYRRKEPQPEEDEN
jgi:phage/plasmid-associated DNA primase